MSGYGIQNKGTSRILLNKGGRVGLTHGGEHYITKKSKKTSYITKKEKPKNWITKKDKSTQGKDIPTMAAKGGRIGLKQGTREYPGKYPGKGGEKGIFQKVKEGISRKIRGKEKTEHKGLEQDVKTGYYTHQAPKDRMDTKPGRWWSRKIATGPHLRPGTKITPSPKKSSNDMSYKERKKEIAKEKKEEKRKKAFDKKHGVK